MVGHSKQLSHAAILLIPHRPRQPPAPSPTSRTPTLTLLLTITLSASLTLLNKAIYTAFSFPFPFYLLATHFAAISLTSRILATTLRPAQLAAYHDRITWRFWSRNVLSVGLAYASAILCSNLAYLSLSVSFVQMLKAFTPVILVLATAILDRQTPPIHTSIVVLAISSGVAVAAYGEIQFVLVGVLFQLAGSLAEVARLIATQRLLQDLNVDPLVALSALSPICFAMALLLAPLFEGLQPLFLIVPRIGLPLLAGSILLALALNIAVLFLVSSTNALVLTLAGILKDICLILGSVLFLGSHVSSTQILGYSLAASGLLYFKFAVQPCPLPCPDDPHHHHPVSPGSSPKIPAWSPDYPHRYEALPLADREPSKLDK
ncbi:hypothetical protein PTTG_00122 [Puccinia triticina 1-1 BBBD Race 1]|uniref:TPT domain-containing protein n=1 Tax=Puccinia triticina (isolate 1-1 / race 1 (BBBD)) TaxID=630390 RepID=A0A180GX63_PUCT1|nr:hypothetical protein PTTG_00122 [Puccinia triticina 1-1 BBBD Race 1]